MRDETNDLERFDALFERLGPRVLAYARRQGGDAMAQDVVSEVFLVAWQRRAKVPDDPLPWLLVVARNLIANQRRRDRRRSELADTVAHLERTAGPSAGVDHGVVERSVLFEALARLSDADRETLLLVAWDGLSGRDAAAVAGCSVRAFEMRLSRARARLADATGTAGAISMSTDQPTFGKAR